MKAVLTTVALPPVEESPFALTQEDLDALEAAALKRSLDLRRRIADVKFYYPRVDELDAVTSTETA